MEIAATAGALGAAGYYFNKDNLNNRQNQFITSPPQGSYPNTENIYTSNNVGNSQYNEYSKAINNWNQSKRPRQKNVSNNFNQRIMNTQTNPVKFLETFFFRKYVSKYVFQNYVSNYFKRNKQIAEYCDIIVAFITEGQVSKGTQNTIDYAKKEKKLIKIINWYIFIYVYTEVLLWILN